MKKKKFYESPIWPAFLSAFVAPGMGQIANREYSKGALLLIASIGSFLWFSKVVAERLSMILPGPPETWRNNQALLKTAMTNMINEAPNMFLTFQVLVIVVWIFGIVDAFISARSRQKPKTGPPKTPDQTSGPIL